MKLTELSKRAVALWGFNKMLTKTAEECAELVVQCCKKTAGSPTTDEKVIDEIADVLIMATRLRYHFNKDLVDARIEYKMTRLENAIQTHEQTGKPPADFGSPPPSQL